jgi:transcriptional regulator with XRE-family HTH domain
MPQSDTQGEDAPDRLRTRDWDMWTAYCRGTTQQQLADKYGISQPAVSQRLKLVKSSIPDEEKQQVVRRHLDVFADMVSELYPLIKADPVPAYSNGRRMTQPNPDDPDGEEVPVWDHSGRVAAMKEVRSILEREAKLTGAEAPTQAEISAVVENRPVELLGLLEQAKARAAAEEAELRGEGQ